MNTLLISALFAMVASSSELATQTDTINRYVINGQDITTFDGSQLVSKTIISYNINYKTTSDVVIKEHKITTKNESGSGVTSTTIKSNAPKFNVDELKGAFNEDEKPLLIIDDEISTGSIEDIDPENVSSMTVLKGKAAETIWGDKGKNGVIEIKTKNKK